MKQLKLLALILVLLLTLNSCTFIKNLFKPDSPVEPDPTELTITSNEVAYLEIGQSYTLTYTTNGTVEVTVSGGTYDSESQKFTATEEGTYTLTVTASAEGKTDTVKTVTVNYIVPSVDKTALSNALNTAAALVRGDYTSASWNKLDAAVEAGRTVLNTSGASEEDVNGAVAAINDAIAQLVSALKKVEIAADELSFTWNETVYKASDYHNFADIVAELKTLNADTEVTLKSQYTPKLDTILAKLNAKLKLAVKSELKNNAMMVVESLGSYVLKAESEDGVSFSWTLDGTEVATTAEYTFTPEEFKEYVIKCTVSKGDNSNVQIWTVSFIESDYFVNKRFEDTIKVEDNDIIVSGALGWGDEEGKKVTLPDLVLSGDFTVYFDLVFTQANNDPNVMALFLNNSNGENILHWVAVREHDNKLEVAVGGNLEEKPTVDMPANTVAIGSTMHFMATRTIVEGKAYLKAYLLDDYGNVLAVNEAQGMSKDYVGDVHLGIQAENAHFTVSNLAVGINDKAISKTALNRALAMSISLVESDYTAESWLALANAKTAASTATTQTALNEAVANIVSATNALVPAEIAKADTTGGNISYGGKQYLASNFENMADVIAELDTLNADTTITLASVYAPKAQEIIAKLVSKVTLDITGAPDNNVQYLVNKLPSFAMTATSAEGATFSWQVNGKDVSTEAAYTFAPTQFGKYVISCTATKGDYSAEKEYTVTFINAGWTSNKPGVAINDDGISVTGDYGWDDMKGKKATISDLTISGNFTLSFDLTFNNQNGVNVFALFFHKSNGDIINDWVAITSQNNKLEVSCLEQKAYKDLPEGTTSIGTKSSFVVKREIIEGRSYITAYLVDENGNILLTNDGTQDSGNRVSSDYTGPVIIGIQSEWAHFDVEGFRLNAEAKANCKADLRTAVVAAGKLTKTDYIESVVTNLEEKVNAANTVLNDVDAEQADIDTALANLATAIAQFKPENYVDVTKAVVDGDTITYSITGLTLKKDDLYNFDAIAEIVNTLNSSDEYAANSVYTAALTEALDSADYKIGLSKIDWKGLVSGNGYITGTSAKYDFAVSSKTKNLTYTWKVNGENVGTDAAYSFTPEHGEKYTISVTLQKGGEAFESETVTFTLSNVSFAVADIKSAMPDRVTVDNTNGGFSSVTGIGWGDWEGRKVLYDDLVFNGSFSVTMDITYRQNGGGANVATIHLLNADTLSPSFGSDWAYVGYGCICLHENPVRLETNWNGTGKKQSSDGGFEDVATAMSGAADLLEVGDTFTVKLTCYRNADRQLQLVYALYDSVNNKWIEFNRNEWAGDMGGGFIVGINIENVGLDVANVRYELLEGTTTYLAGSVKSRAALSAALVEYASIDPSDYVNSAEFLKAYRTGYALMSNNSTDVDYDAAAKAIIDAAETLVERDVAVSVDILDKGYANYAGVDQFTAVFADGVETTDVKWSFKLNGEAKTVDGATLALEEGEYTEVKLSFKVGDDTVTYQYQDFKAGSVALKSNTDRVILNEDGTVSIDDGAGWGQKDQLVIDGLRVQEFELVFNSKYEGTPGGGYRVMCINLFGEDIRPVFGYQREDHGDRAQIGFDSNGQWTDINNTEAEGEPYDYIFEDATKFGLKLHRDGEGKFYITFTVYAADGSVIASRDCDYTRWYSTNTEIRFTFENVDLTLSDFQVYYN